MRNCKFGRSSYSGSDTRHSQEAIALKQACALGSSEPFNVYDTSAPAAINLTASSMEDVKYSISYLRS